MLYTYEKRMTKEEYEQFVREYVRNGVVDKPAYDGESAKIRCFDEEQQVKILEKVGFC